MMSDSSLTLYRLAGPGDVDALVSLRLAFLKELSPLPDQVPTMRGALHDYFMTHLAAGDFFAYIAESEGRIIATSGMVIHHHPPAVRNPNGRVAYIMNMYTLPEFRGRGIATALLQKLVELARQNECHRVQLHALAQGKSIYEKAGFVRAKTAMKLDLLEGSE
jgi:GNAT superfamily N-acetyltransferase